MNNSANEPGERKALHSVYELRTSATRLVSKQVVLTLFYNRFSPAFIIKGVVDLARKKPCGMGVKF